MSDRKAELERKKEKLRQIREEKERRKREREEAEAKAGALKTASGQAGSAAAHHDINKQLADMGIQPVDAVLESLSTIASTASIKSEAGLDDYSQQRGGGRDDSMMSHHLHTQDGGLEMASLGSRRSGRKLNLGVTNVHHTEIPPRAMETYAKQTQTIESGTDTINAKMGVRGGRDYYTFAFDDPEELYAEDSLPGMPDSGSPSSGSPANMYLSKLPPHLLTGSGLPEVREVKPAVSKEEEEARKAKEEEEKRKKALSEEEKQLILMSDNFHQFFDRSSRLVERAIYEDIDVFKDYTGVYDNNEGLEDKAGYSLTFNRYFADEKWTKNRVVTSLDWSSAFPELLVTSYDKNPDSAADVDGVCLVWNTRFKKTTPEHIFHCQSQVMSATFARFHPNLILGGTYSGQIVLWDNRVPKRTPVQRSPLSSSAHTHPVYCMRVVGTQNAHNLISISTDGKMCSWSLDMLSQPQETLELQQKQSKNVPVTCLSFPANDVNNFIVGSEEGSVFTACRHGSRAGVLDVFDGHQAPVTGLDTHPGVGGTVDFSHLFLTSSMDWTVKLWSLKEPRPLYSFEDNGEYVYDVAWSPIHPALFATVDGNGRLELWNLNSDTEVATVSVTVEGAPALNRVSWTQSGLHVTVGDDSGKIWVYDVGEQLALPNADEWNKFAYTLQDIKHNQTEEDLEMKMASMAHHQHHHHTGIVVPGSAGTSGGGGGGSGPGSLTSLPSMSASPMR